MPQSRASQAKANVPGVPRGGAWLHARGHRAQDALAPLPGADGMTADRKRTACQGRSPHPHPAPEINQLPTWIDSVSVISSEPTPVSHFNEKQQ